jgi:urocanate hydratase
LIDKSDEAPKASDLLPRPLESAANHNFVTLDPPSSAALGFILQVERIYATLIGSAPSAVDPNLGGKLLYAGDLDRYGWTLAVAANIAGAATLAASAELAGGKQALREGVVDFLVTSLDEALRILKNEIRKRETVAVCVISSTAALELEMNERGVRPDIVRCDSVSLEEQLSYLTWRVAAAAARWLPKLDAIALQCLEFKSDQFVESTRRWLRLAPRYLGRHAQSIRLVHGTREFYEAFIEDVRSAVECAEIPVEVEIRFKGPGMDENQSIRQQAP